MDFSAKIIDWYKKNKRDLPWRNTTNPYFVWLSEIILQQTRVNQGLSYFHSFKKEFPSLRKLASAEEDKILKVWEGLGYYSRARNMHFTAKYIIKNLGGNFPKKYEDLLTLKGVGPYTAAAIASFCFNEPKAVVDGNVMRVLSRFLGIYKPINSIEGQKDLNAAATILLNKRKSALHNQAIMEFGAIQCTPANPHCATCVLNTNCYAYANNKVKILPIKNKKKSIRTRYLNYFTIRYKNAIFLNKRLEKGIWKNLYELPLIESENQFDSDKELLKQIKTKFKTENILIVNKTPEITHNLTHQKLFIRFYLIELSDYNFLRKNYICINSKNLNYYALPIVIRKYLNHFYNLE
jgi:A/G-specific adenine glycosylase